MALIVLFLSAVFGLLGSLALGHLLLRMMFRFRPLESDTQQRFFEPSKIGMFAMVPPVFFAGFALFSMMFNGVSMEHVHLSDAHQRIFILLASFGLLLQLFLGQRLSLVLDTGLDSKERLIVDRVLFGSIHSFAREEISAIDLYRPALNPRFPRIQLGLKDGRTIRLVFGAEVRAELEAWLNQERQFD